MVKTYDDLTDKEIDKLSHAWLDIVKGLEVYELITNTDLTDYINSEIWDNIQFQKDNEGIADDD